MERIQIGLQQLQRLCKRQIKQMQLNSFPSENWRRPLGRPRSMWMNTIQQELKSNNLSLIEATDVVENRPLWRLMSTFGTTHS